MDLDSELDRLYRSPAADFVAERNKLAKALRQSGDSSDAERIARLPRPNPVAWGINQLHFLDPELLDALRKAGSALRKAQQSGDTERFASRKQAHQDALGAATDRATSIVEESGAGSAATLRRRIEMTLMVLSTAEGDVDPPPGRMSGELEPLGFDAFTAMPAAPTPKPSKRARDPEDTAQAEKIDAVKEAFNGADKELRRLEREAERSRDAAERAERDVEEAERRVESARSARDDARRAAKDAQRKVDAAKKELDRARRALDNLE